MNRLTYIRFSLTHWLRLAVSPSYRKHVRAVEADVDAHTATLVGGETLYNVHSSVACQPGPCAVHNPSPTHMSGWPQHWRADRRMIERVCPHGIDHPDPDQLAFWAKCHGTPAADLLGLHTCDGCCLPPATGEPSTHTPSGPQSESQPHEPDPWLHALNKALIPSLGHCTIHDTLEPATLDTYRVCGECGHAYATAQDLLDAERAMLTEMRQHADHRALGYPTRDAMLAAMQPVVDPEKIYACPHCTHDF